MNFERFGYKAKKTNSKKWLYAGFDDSEELLRWTIRDKDNDKYDPAWIDRKTICQCTGLRDSDGRLIYENDILSVEKPGEEPVKATVKFDESENSIIVEMRGVSWYWGSRFFRCAQCGDWTIKVIGNKFDKERENETSEQQYYFEVERPVVCRKYECIRVKATSKEEALELVQDETFWDANDLDIELVDDHEVIRYDDPVITQWVKIEKEEENEP